MKNKRRPLSSFHPPGFPPLGPQRDGVSVRPVPSPPPHGTGSTGLVPAPVAGGTGPHTHTRYLWHRQKRQKHPLQTSPETQNLFLTLLLSLTKTQPGFN